MDSSYAAALAAATDPSTTTQWQDESPGVASIDSQYIPIFRAWLASVDSPVAREPSVWRAITSNWISFLSATSRTPSTTLALIRKRVRFRAGTETDAQAKERFKIDWRARFSTQGAYWRLSDTTEALLERWPLQARLLMNRVVEGDPACPFASLVGDFSKQRRFNAVWTGLICFLLYCQEDGSLGEMGLELSENREDDLLDIATALIYDGYPKPGDGGESPSTEQAIHPFIVDLLIDTNATPRTNPLLWWIVVLVRSSLEQGPDDYISRGHFDRNILAMDLDINGRLEGILHFAKAFLLDTAFATWEPEPRTQILEVQDELNEVDNAWISEFSSTKTANTSDNRTCNSPAWKSILHHVDVTFKKYLVELKGTPMYQLISFRKQWVQK